MADDTAPAPEPELAEPASETEPAAETEPASDPEPAPDDAGAAAAAESEASGGDAQPEAEPAAAAAAPSTAAPAAPATPAPAPVHLLPLRPAPLPQPVDRVVRAAFAATGLPEILEQRRTEAEAITVQLVGVTPLAGTIRAGSHLRFVVRFYDFASAPTAPVSLHPLGGGHAPYLLVSEALPEWLSAATVVSSEFTGAPGLSLRFEVPGDAAESARLGSYIRGGGCMQVEAWDDASLLHVGTARVPLSDLANGKPEVWHEAALLEPVLPSQDAGHAGRCCGLLQLRVARSAGKKKPVPVPKSMAEPVQQPSDAEAGGKGKGKGKGSSKKEPTENERKLMRLQRMQAARFSTADTERLDVHHKLDDARAEARTSAIKQSLEAAAEQSVLVECTAGSEPFFEHKLTNLQSRKEKFVVTCSPDAPALSAVHHKGAVLELVTDAAHWGELKRAAGLNTPISEAVCAAKRVDDKPTKGGKKKTKDAKSKAEPEPEPGDDNDSSEKDTPADKAAAAEEEEEDLLADLSYTVELAAGETVFLPFHWRIRSTASSSGSVEPLGEFAPLDMAQLLGARPLPHGAVFAAEVGLLHAVGSGRTSVDPSQPEDCAAAAGRVKVSGGGKLGVVSRLIVQLLPRPLVVDEALPLYGIEHGMLHTSIPLPAERMPAWRRGASSSEFSSSAATDGSADFRSWRVVCTDASVGARIAWGADASSAGGGGGGAEIQLQTRCGVATQTPKVCYLFLYANEAAAAAGTGNNTAAGCVSAVIQLLLHTARACSVYARYAGQANGGSLLLPPSLAKSTIPLQHFSSDPLQLDIQSAANEGDADSELLLSVSTTSDGEHCWRTATVQPAISATTNDASQGGQGGSPRSVPRKVLGQWLVSSSVPPIEISRTLRVRVHRVPALRVEIPNAYGVSKTFKLHTDRPELLSMPPPPSSPAAAAADAGAVQDDDGDGGAAKEDVLGSRMRYAVTVDARSNKSVQWDVNVAPATAAAATAAASSGEGERMERALIFVTDERDKIEETIELWLEILPLPTSATVSPVSSPVGGASSVMIKTVPLTITTSADLTVDARYDVIVNSVSPEFQSSGSDSGINFSVWQTLTGYTAEDKKAKKEKPPPIKYDQSPFTARNSAAPTYADVMWSDVPTSGTPEEGAAAAADSALKYIVHALAPDLSRRPKRLPSGLGKEEAYAALVAVYFRAMWQATAIAGPGCSIGMPPLGAGVFANDAADVRSAAVLAHAAYCASGGTASVSIALWSPDGTPASDMAEWQEAAGSAPVGNSVLLTRLREALGPAGQPTLLSRVPKAHTTTELTSLLKAAAKGSKDEQGPEEEDRNVEAPPPPPPPLSDGGGGGESHGHGVEVARMATEFLAARADKDKAKQKQLKKQLADGTWTPLLSSLAAQVDSSPPFGYYGYAAAAGRGTCGALLSYLCSAEFLHFDLQKQK